METWNEILYPVNSLYHSWFQRVLTVVVWMAVKPIFVWYCHVGRILLPNLALVFHLFIIIFRSNAVFLFYLDSINTVWNCCFFPTPFGIHCNIPLVHLIWHAIKVYFCSLFLRHRTLCFSASTEWNKLPVDIRWAPTTLQTFKNRLNMHLFQLCFN